LAGDIARTHAHRPNQRNLRDSYHEWFGNQAESLEAPTKKGPRLFIDLDASHSHGCVKQA